MSDVPPSDLLGAFYAYAPGVVLQRSMIDGLMAAYAAGNYAPLTQAQVLAIAGTLPAYPVTLPRFDDSNPFDFPDSNGPPRPAGVPASSLPPPVPLPEFTLDTPGSDVLGGPNPLG